MFSSQDKLFMQRAIELAKESFDDGEVPVGAVIVQNEMIIGEGKNKVIFDNDVTSHAETNHRQTQSQTKIHKCGQIPDVTHAQTCADTHT